MLVTCTQYAATARDVNSADLPLGGRKLASTARTSAGAFAALERTARIVRIATDTDIQIDFSGGATSDQSEFLPAGTVEFFSVSGGAVLTVATI